MKKIILVSVLAFCYLTSCNKTYYCTCSINGTTQFETYTLYNTKRKAIDNCNNTTNTTRTCALEAY